MTSNIGSHFILEHAKGDWALVETQVMHELQRTFKPEFLNRVDDIIIFRTLGTAEIERIVEIQLRHLTKLLADRKLTIELTLNDKDPAPPLARQLMHDIDQGRGGQEAFSRMVENRCCEPGS